MLVIMMMFSFYLGTPTMLALGIFGWPNGRGFWDGAARVWCIVIGALMASTTARVMLL